MIGALGKYLDGSGNHWMPQEVNMTSDIALWKSEEETTDDGLRRIVKRNLGFFQQQIHLLQIILFLLFID